jgi:hypothetical protein
LTRWIYLFLEKLNVKIKLQSTVLLLAAIQVAVQHGLRLRFSRPVPLDPVVVAQPSRFVSMSFLAIAVQ